MIVISNKGIESVTNSNRLKKLDDLLTALPYMRERVLSKADYHSLCIVMDIELAIERAFLSKEEQFILYNKYMLGYTQLEIATKLGKSRGSVRHIEYVLLTRIARYYYRRR